MEDKKSQLKLFVILGLVLTSALIVVAVVNESINSSRPLEKIDIAKDIKSCILANFEYNFSKDTIIFFYDDTLCYNCKDIISDLRNAGFQIFETTDCFSDVGPSLAVCLKNLNTVQNFTTEEIYNFTEECKKYTKPQRKFIEIPRPGDEDGDAPLVIYEDTGEILGLSKTIYDIFGNNYSSITEIILNVDNIAEIIAEEHQKEARELLKDYIQEFKKEREKIYQERNVLYQQEKECIELRNNKILEYKEKLREKYRENKTFIEFPSEVKKLREQYLSGINCSSIRDQIEEHKRRNRVNLTFVVIDPKGQQISEYTPEEIEFLKKYSNRDKNKILAQLDSNQILVEKISDKNEISVKSKLPDWVKNLLKKRYE